MKRNVIIGLVIGVLVIAAAGVGYSAWQVKQRGDEQDRKAEVVATTRAVDDKLAEVWDRIDERDQAWKRLVSDPGVSSLNTMINTSESDIERLREGVAEARELIEEIPSEEVQDAYTAVCDELEDSFDTMVEEAADAKPLCDAYDVILGAVENDVAGWNALQDSIQACNADNHSEGKALAQAAQEQYQAYRDKYAQAASLSGVQAVADAVPYAEACLQLSVMQQELARLGSKGGVNSYNAQIDKLNEMQAHATSLSGLPELAGEALWSEAEASYGRFSLRAKKAEGLWEDARDLVSAGEV